MKESSYKEYADYLSELGYDCSNLSVEQMDEVGMAAERAQHDWDWAQASSDGSEDRDLKVLEAKQNVAASDAQSEDELVARYVGGFYDDYGL